MAACQSCKLIGPVGRVLRDEKGTRFQLHLKKSPDLGERKY